MCPRGDDAKATGQMDRIVRVVTAASSAISGTFTLVFGGYADDLLSRVHSVPIV